MNNEDNEVTFNFSLNIQHGSCYNELKAALAKKVEDIKVTKRHELIVLGPASSKTVANIENDGDNTNGDSIEITGGNNA